MTRFQLVPNDNKSCGEGRVLGEGGLSNFGIGLTVYRRIGGRDRPRTRFARTGAAALCGSHGWDRQGLSNFEISGLAQRWTDR